MKDPTKLVPITAGVVSCPEGHMHLDVTKVLEWAGYPATPQNVQQMESAMRELCKAARIELFFKDGCREGRAWNAQHEITESE